MRDPVSGPGLHVGEPQAKDRDVGHQQSATAIYDITERCIDMLERLAPTDDAASPTDQTSLASDNLPAEDHTASSTTESVRDIRGVRNSFAFWIDYTGALAPIGAALDDRLDGHDEIKDMVVELLEMVERNLRRRRCSKSERASSHDCGQSVDFCPCENSGTHEYRVHRYT
jgi:hypothetical protein